MREIEDAHEALNRVDQQVQRMRWIIRNPRLALEILGTASGHNDDDKMALEFLKRLDEYRLPFGVPQHREYDASVAADAHRCALYRG